MLSLAESPFGFELHEQLVPTLRRFATLPSSFHLKPTVPAVRPQNHLADSLPCPAPPVTDEECVLRIITVMA